MLQAEWKRLINEIEKAIQKTAASYKEDYDRSIKDHDATIGTPLNSLKEHFERYKVQQHTNDEKRRRREIATIVLLAATTLFTAITIGVFYAQLIQMKIGIRHADEATRIQHFDTLAALANAKDVAVQQANDTAAALDLSRQAVEAANKSADAALMQASAIAANFGVSTVSHAYSAAGEELQSGSTEQTASFAVNPALKNIGGTSAKDVVTWFNIVMTYTDRPRSVGERLSVPCAPKNPPSTKEAAPAVVAPGETDTLFAQILTFEQVSEASGLYTAVVIFVTGHAEYKDIFFPKTPIHHLDWCDLMLPNNITKNQFSFVNKGRSSD
jgi:hypothetical protein